MENKINDNDAIKALDICGHLEGCAECPLGSLEGIDKCMHTLLLNALDLINRLRAEKERLETELELKRTILNSYALQYGTVKDQSKKIAEIESRARKEFAEKLIQQVKAIHNAVDTSKTNNDYNTGFHSATSQIQGLIDYMFDDTIKLDGKENSDD